ncbi:MAG: hypothetical protein QM564_04940 [Bergeyella sp.]
MKKHRFATIIAIALISCNKIEEKINETIDKTSETVKQKAKDKVKETIDSTISESINSVTNAENAVFTEVFPDEIPAFITEFKGKKVTLPNGSPVYVFKYKAEKDSLIFFLESQPASDESRSDKTARKIDGQSIIDKLSLVEKFIPQGTIDTSFLEEIKNDENIEFYRLKRIPNNSTVIYNPKNNQVFQFIEIVK